MYKQPNKIIRFLNFICPPKIYVIFEVNERNLRKIRLLGHIGFNVVIYRIYRND